MKNHAGTSGPRTCQQYVPPTHTNTQPWVPSNLTLICHPSAFSLFTFFALLQSCSLAKHGLGLFISNLYDFFPMNRK